MCIAFAQSAYVLYARGVNDEASRLAVIITLHHPNRVNSQYRPVQYIARHESNRLEPLDA